MVKLFHVAQRDIDMGDLLLDIFQVGKFLVELRPDMPVINLWSISRRSEYQR